MDEVDAQVKSRPRRSCDDRGGLCGESWLWSNLSRLSQWVWRMEERWCSARGLDHFAAQQQLWRLLTDAECVDAESFSPSTAVVPPRPGASALGDLEVALFSVASVV